MERDEFLSKLGIGVLAVCTGCGLASCGGKSNDPTPGGGGGGHWTTGMVRTVTGSLWLLEPPQSTHQSTHPLSYAGRQYH